MSDYRTDGIPHSIVKQWGNTRRYGNDVVSLGAGFLGGGRAEYMAGGLVARIVDIPADGAVKRGVTIEGADETFAGEMDRLKVLPALGDALRWARLDGGGAIVLMTEEAGGAALDQPLNPDRIMRIQELRTVSVVEMTPGPNTIQDANSPNFGWPETYKVKLYGNNSREVEVHESRIIEVPGDPVPTGIEAMDVGRVPWRGRGVSLAVLQAVQQYRSARKWADVLLERKQQPVHRMAGLAQMIMAGQEGVVRTRIDLVDLNRSILTGVAVDKDDDYTILNADLNGVKDVIQEAQVAVAAECGLPVTVLFGRSPGGLNATGASDWAIVYELCAQLQTDRLNPALERLVSLIFAQSAVPDMGTPDQWAIKWNGLAVLSDAEQAEVENKRADTALKVATALEKLQGTGAISQDEAHTYLAENRQYGIEPEGDEGASGAAARDYAGRT